MATTPVMPPMVMPSIPGSGGPAPDPQPPQPQPSPQPSPEPKPEPEAPAPEPAKPEPSPFDSLVNYATDDGEKPVGDKATKPEPPAPPAPGDKKPEGDPKAPDAPKPGEKQLPPDFRKGHEKLKAEYAKLQADYEKLRNDPEKKALQERVAEREKKIAHLEETVKYSAWERSDEFRDRYDKPFEDAWNSGRAKIASMKITTPEGETRQGTPEDFDRIMSIMDGDEAATAIEEMFGTPAKAASVSLARDKVIEANEKRAMALEDYRKNFTEREKARHEKEQASLAERVQLWEALNKHAAETHPEWFGRKDDDQKWNELLEKGYSRADQVFNGQTSGMTDKEVVALHSETRNKAAAFGPLTYMISKLQAEKAELQKVIDDFKASAPGVPEGNGSPVPGPGQGQVKDIVDGLDDIAKPGTFF